MASTVRSTVVAVFLVAVPLASCSDGGPDIVSGGEIFLRGGGGDPRIGLVVNSTGRALTLFQLGAPEERRQIELGASSAVTPTGLSVRGRRAVIPLGNAASVAVVDLDGLRVSRFFLFPGGNATGSAFVDDRTVLAGNLLDDYVGRFEIGQEAGDITETVPVAPAPTRILHRDGTAYVISGNLDESFQPIGDGVVTALDPQTLTVDGTVSTGGTNPQDAAFGPDGLLYVINTGDFSSSGTLGIIDPESLTLVDAIAGMGVGPGSISIGEDGRAYISGFFFGTLVWDTDTRSFVRSPENALCAPLPEGGCRGAADTRSDGAGRIYQLFFGSASEDLEPWAFVYDATSFELADSVDVGTGPIAIDIEAF